MSVLGIDVSSRITVPAAIASAGAGFVISRLGTEPGGLDPSGLPNVRAVRAAGLVPGVYEFLTGPFTVAGRTITPADRAKRLSDAIADELAAGLLVALDVERPRYADLHPVPTRADVDAFMNGWAKLHPSHIVPQYGSFPGPLRYSGSEHGPLWRAAWSPAAHGKTLTAGYAAAGGDKAAMWSTAVLGWLGPTFWQFTNDVAGVGLVADGDAFHGTLAELRALAGAPAPAPAPTFVALYSAINLRSGPGIGFPIVGHVDHGAIVRGRLRTGSWYSGAAGTHNSWLELEAINSRACPPGRFTAAAFYAPR